MKAAIYSRKSRFTGKGESIENQVQMCKEYASMNLRSKQIEEFLIYEDEGFSGGNTNRPEFQRMMNYAENKKFDILICYRLDRSFIFSSNQPLPPITTIVSRCFF